MIIIIKSHTNLCVIIELQNATPVLIIFKDITVCNIMKLHFFNLRNFILKWINEKVILNTISKQSLSPPLSEETLQYFLFGSSQVLPHTYMSCNSLAMSFKSYIFFVNKSHAYVSILKIIMSVRWFLLHLKVLTIFFETKRL